MQLIWQGGLAFRAEPEAGDTNPGFTLDADPAHGGQNLGPTPADALLASAAACSAMDTLAILRKNGQTITSYKVEIEYERRTEGDWPRPFERIVLRHVVGGENLDEVAVKRSLELTDQKYCTIVATLRSTPDVQLAYRIEDAA